MKLPAILSLLALMGAAPVQSPPQPASAPLACDGQIAILYDNQIKQGGSLEGVVQAAQAQEAWYRAHGVTSNRILIARIVKHDAATNTSSYAADEVFTLHVNPPPAEKKGAGVKPDYVEKYKQNATILDRKTICLPRY
jgi:hypothetical protein